MLKIYVGVTDWAWYDFLRDGNYEEVNFWKPSGRSFRAIDEGDLFLFKMKSTHGGKIAGGGFFTKYLTMTVDWAWRAFGNENGVVNLAQLSDTIDRYRMRNRMAHESSNIGCIILNDVFYFDESDWFAAPGDWKAIVSGKSFSLDTVEGRWLYEQTEIRRRGVALNPVQEMRIDVGALDEEERYARSLTRHRLGQGAFRALVADAYHNRCAISGERTMPVLQAAHIRPYSKEGPHAVPNGLLLRSDIHTLFDAGYITVTPNLTVKVSRRVHDDFGNGRMYYAFQGECLTVIPDESRNKPLRDYLEWHNDCVYLG